MMIKLLEAQEYGVPSGHSYSIQKEYRLVDVFLNTDNIIRIYRNDELKKIFQEKYKEELKGIGKDVEFSRIMVVGGNTINVVGTPEYIINITLQDKVLMERRVI